MHALQDGHSHYRPRDPNVAGTWAQARVHVPVGVLRAPDPIAYAADPVAGFGRLVIDGWAGNPREEIFATYDVRAALNEALVHDGCGLIIDLADNDGGNMWPMMGGIAPLYDDVVLQTFENRAGQRTVIDVADGALRRNSSVTPAIPDLPALRAEPRNIALIVGPRTASSAEILALGFRYQDNARLFGQPTRGATTSNSTHGLSNGAVVALATGRILDRRGDVQEGPLVPDEITDEPLPAATRWLQSRCTTPRPAPAGS